MRRDDLEAVLRRLAPRIPAHEFEATIDHALISRGLRHASPEAAVWLSLVAYIRHTFTDYDALLDDGYDIESARHFVKGDIEERLAAWGSRRVLDDEA